MKVEIKYIGQRITYSGLRDTILDEKLKENDTILLNSINFDDIVLEYLDIYKESMTFPHILLGVLIKESSNISVPINRIGIIRNDSESIREVNTNEFEYYDGEIVYRCGWCGNIVDEKGVVLDGYQRNRAINFIENHDESIVHHTNGLCCPNGHD